MSDKVNASSSSALAEALMSGFLREYVKQSVMLTQSTLLPRPVFGESYLSVSQPYYISASGPIETSADIDVLAPIVQQEFAKAIAFADTDEFEDGYDSRFSITIGYLFGRHPRVTAELISDLIYRTDTLFELKREALKAIARHQDNIEPTARYSIFSSALKHPDASIREATINAIELMWDKNSAPLLRTAAAIEPDESIRDLLVAVASDLER